ncbi:MAG: hypothetical protein AAF621_00345 [Pseudomonadota bacterium]
MKENFDYLADKLFHSLYKCKNPCKGHERSGLFATQKDIALPIQLLPVLQAGVVAFQSLLHCEMLHTPSPTWTELAKCLFKQVTHIKPVQTISGTEKTPEADELLQNYRISEHKQSSHDFLQNILKNISETPMLGVWSLYVPFLETAFKKGLCPVSFFYCLVAYEDQDKVVSVAQDILELPYLENSQNVKPNSLRLLNAPDAPLKEQTIDYLSDILKISVVEKAFHL